MVIGINATAAFKKPRTGVEEYTYQLIKHLTMLEESRKHRFILYAPTHLSGSRHVLPANFCVSRLSWNKPMWTQLRLSAHLLFCQPDCLFVPVHVVPVVHPRKTVVTIHELEYEKYPNLYSFSQKKYLRFATKYSLKKASNIICVSESTKKDLIELYDTDPQKITVVYHGIELPKKIKSKQNIAKNAKPYILFIGRIETKKNVHGLVQAFDILKDKYSLAHQLVLAGSQGYGYENVKIQILNSKYKDDIIEKGYVLEKQKKSLLRNASVFAMPSFYEGFGMPILEAQSYGVPVVTSNVSSMPEVAGKAAVLIDPESADSIASGIYQIINDRIAHAQLVKKGYENLHRFSWQKSAQQTLAVLVQ